MGLPLSTNLANTAYWTSAEDRPDIMISKLAQARGTPNTLEKSREVRASKRGR
jgi:hypothetical protein